MDEQTQKQEAEKLQNLGIPVKSEWLDGVTYHWDGSISYDISGWVSHDAWNDFASGINTSEAVVDWDIDYDMSWECDGRVSGVILIAQRGVTWRLNPTTPGK